MSWIFSKYHIFQILYLLNILSRWHTHTHTPTVANYVGTFLITGHAFQVFCPLASALILAGSSPAGIQLVFFKWRKPTGLWALRTGLYWLNPPCFYSRRYLSAPRKPQPLRPSLTFAPLAAQALLLTSFRAIFYRLPKQNKAHTNLHFEDFSSIYFCYFI